MDLSVKTSLEPPDGGMDLSINKLPGVCTSMPMNLADSSIENTEHDSEDDCTSRSSTSSSLESDDGEMDLSVEKIRQELPNLRGSRTSVVTDIHIENKQSQSEDDFTDFRLLDDSELEGVEMDLRIKSESQGESDCAVMDLSLHLSQNETELDVCERIEIETALGLETEAHKHGGTKKEESDSSFDMSMDDSSVSEEEEMSEVCRETKGEARQRRTSSRRKVNKVTEKSPVDSGTEDSSCSGMEQEEQPITAQFERALQEFSMKQFPLKSVFVEVDVLGPDSQSLDVTRVRNEGEPKREPLDSDPFLNVADFLELETKVTSETSVETHATGAITPKKVTFTCTACDLSFSSTLYLSQHIKHCRKLKANCFKPSAVLAENGSKAEPTIERKNNAGISNCTYKSNPGVKKKKPGYVLATCNICGKDLRNNRSLKQHMFLHRLEAGERPFACVQCPASFTQNCDLTKHKRQHTGEKPYACDSCDARFTLVSNLSKHRKKHTGEKPHVCHQCGATFAESGSLTRHARQHSGERPYACADCGATFGQSSSLTRHKRKHTGERPYACNVCDARFTESGNLNSHRRLHTGEKPYTCPRCGVGHARLSYLKNHARNCQSTLGS